MRILPKMGPTLMAIQSMRPVKMVDGTMHPVPMMEVKKTVLFTFFKAPKRRVNNLADKQENVSKTKRGNPNLVSAKKCHVYVLLLHFMVIFFF